LALQSGNQKWQPEAAIQTAIEAANACHFFIGGSKTIGIKIGGIGKHGAHDAARQLELPQIQGLSGLKGTD
jgi:hypothetical protein